jgi:hypothetical protein
MLVVHYRIEVEQERQDGDQICAREHQSHVLSNQES